MEVRVVISHYKEKIDWVYFIKYPFVIYSNHSLLPGYLTNNGNEANGYLKYIIDNYNELPDYSIFIHGDRTTYHHDGNLDDIINNLEFNKSFQTINNKLESYFIPHKHYSLMSKYIDDFEKIMKRKIIINNIQFYGNAQFYVYKNNILKYDIKTYKKLYEWKNDMKELNYWDNGLIFEFMWYEIFK